MTYIEIAEGPLYKTLKLAPLALALSMSLNASIIGNGPPNQTGGSNMNDYLEADTFTLAGAFTISQIAFWTLQTSAADYAGTTYWAFYTNNAGSPGTVIASADPVLVGTSTGNTTLGLNEFSYTIPVNVALGAGTYWLGLHNGLLPTTPTTDFYWAWNANTGNSKSQDLVLGLASPWISNFSALAYELTVAPTVSGVPEPATLCLTGAGLLAALVARRKNRTHIGEEKR